MNDRNTLSQEVWKDLAGSVYDELIRSKDSALEHLVSESPHVRIAAIEVCRTIWNGCTDVMFLNACQTLAVSDPSEAVRLHAIAAIGRAFQSSRSPSASQFLADLTADIKNSEDVRQAAYWALREIQFGLIEDDIIRRCIAITKTLLAMGMPLARAMRLSEDKVKATVLCGGRFPDALWDCPTHIDWDFVNQFASTERETGTG